MLGRPWDPEELKRKRHKIKIWQRKLLQKKKLKLNRR
jgi:hypothetical protein